MLQESASMKRWFARAVVLMLLLMAASASSAATEQEQFVKALGKFAPEAGKKAKQLCYCIGEGAVPVVGELRPAFFAFNGVTSYKLECVLPTFRTSDGSVISTMTCDDVGMTHGFERLTK